MIVKEGAEVIGTVRADEGVIIAGIVVAADPDLPAVATAGLWVLSETAKVKGSVAYGRHRAYEGGSFNGRAIPYAEFDQKP